MAESKIVLVTGASGMLGREIKSAFEAGGWTAYGTAFSRPDEKGGIYQVDLADRTSFISLVDKLNPTAIVHSAANRYPDRVAEDPTAGLAINVQASEMIAAEAAARKIFLIYISTDFVFPGTLFVPAPTDRLTCSTITGQESLGSLEKYTIDADTQPINGYGKTKRMGELAIEQVRRAAAGFVSSDDGQVDEGKPPISVSLRVPLLYGAVSGKNDPSRNNVHGLADEILEKAEKVKNGDAVTSIKLDDVLIRYPTWTGDVGRVCRQICERYMGLDNSAPKPKSWPGTLQFSSQDPITRFGMGLILSSILGFDQTGFSDDIKEQEEQVKSASSDLPIRLVPDRSLYQSVDSINSQLKDPSKQPSEVELLQSCDRPIHCRLDVSALQQLGIDTSTVSFESWWRRELRAFRH